MRPSRTRQAESWPDGVRGRIRFLRVSASRPANPSIFRRRRSDCSRKYWTTWRTCNGVALTPLHAELTTRQAADLLQVSRTHLVQLLDEGRIPCRKVGAHRRVRARDILDYRRETESRRHKALDELTAVDQNLGFQ